MTQEEIIRINEQNQETACLQDYTNHCKHIVQGIEELDNVQPERAIWELVQNARDLAKDDVVEIRMTLDTKGFRFEHKGMPFTYGTLTSLIKQVSSKHVSSATEEGNEPAGQFGTGFITTHKFGRKIYLGGSLEVNNMFYDIDNFEIDRECDVRDVGSLITKMRNQVKSVDNIWKEQSPKQCREWTSLYYPFARDDQRNNAYNAVCMVQKLMPYVFAINKTLKKCVVDNKIDGCSIVLCREEDKPVDETNLHVCTISQSKDNQQEKITCYYLQSEDGKDVIILPLSSPTQVCELIDVPRLFVYFPLLGTEDMGVNFIFHSARFYPVEARDSIVLPCENQDKAVKYEENEKVIEQLSKMVFDFLQTCADRFDNALALSRVAFKDRHTTDRKTKEYLNDLQQMWVDTFCTLSVIPTEQGKKSAAKQDGVWFFSMDMVNHFQKKDTESQYDVFYEYALRTGKLLPAKDVALEWSKTVNEWWGGSAKTRCLGYKDIAKAVKSVDDDLLAFDQLLVDCGQEELLSKFPLIPNRENVLKCKQDLYNGKTITQELYTLVQDIVPDFTEQLADERFAEFVDDEASRRDLRDALTDEERALRQGTIQGQPQTSLQRDIATAIRHFCCSFYTANDDKNRRAMMSVICKKNGETFDEQLKIIPKMEENEPDLYQTMYRLCVESELLTIIDENNCCLIEKELLKELVACICQEEEENQNRFWKYAVLPDQGRGFYVCQKENLMLRDEQVDEDMADLYQRLFDEDLHERWLDSDFKRFCPNMQTDKAKEIAEKIENELLKEKNNDEILTVLQKLDDGNTVWKELFPKIDMNKANLFFEFVDSDVKPELYSIMKEKPETIQQLAKIAKNPELTRKAQDLLQEEQQKKQERQFKTQIGKRVEQLLRQELNHVLKEHGYNLQVIESQYGHDIVVEIDGKAVYNIEVKSLWKKYGDGCARMTPLQCQCSIENKDNYVLCVVDMRNRNALDSDTITGAEVIESLKAVLNIGELNEPLGDCVNPDVSKVYVGGDDGVDCKIIVPYNVWSRGCSFEELVSKIEERIQCVMGN